MIVHLIRHGVTTYNEQSRYQGFSDAPLSEAGRAALKQADFSAEKVYVSPLIRARQTAAILFPGAKQIPVEGLKEINFGKFEGRTYEEMKTDPEYTAWLDSNCEGQIPEGENRAAFTARTMRTFEQLLADCHARGEETVVIVAHGGTQLSVMNTYFPGVKPSHDWQLPQGQGHTMDITLDAEGRVTDVKLIES